MKKFLTIMLVLVVSISAIAGITHFIKTDKKEEDENLIVKASYEQLITDLEKDIALSLENVAALEAEIELNGLTISSLTTSVVSYKNQVASLESSVEKYEEDIIVKTSELEAKSGEIAELTAELESSNEENEELTAQLELLNKEKSAIETELAELTNEKETLETLIEEKNAEIAELSNSISEKNTELENLSSSIAEKQTIIEDLNTQVENLLLNIENLESENETLTSQVLDLQSQVSTLNVQIEELNATIFDLNTRIDVLEEQLANTEKDPNKTYIDELLNYTLTFKKIDDEKCLVTSTSFYSIYVMSLEDYAIVELYNDGLRYNKQYVLSNNSVLMSTTADNGFILYDSDQNVIEKVYNFGYFGGRFGVLTNGNALFTTNTSLTFFNFQSREFIEVLNSTSVNTPIGLNNGSALYGCMSGTNAGVYYFDIETYESIQIYSGSVGLFYAMSFDNKCLVTCNSGLAGIWLFNADDLSFNCLIDTSYYSLIEENTEKTGIYIGNGGSNPTYKYFFDYATETLTEVA